MDWLALHLPALSLEVHERGLAHPPPLAIAEHERLIACNGPARQWGVHPGLAQSAGRALLADLRILPRNVRAERAALERLAAWAMRFSDQVSLAPPRGLVLESARSLRLFGGAEALHALVGDGVRGLGYQVRCVLAPTPAGALVLAAAGADGPVPDLAALRPALGALPVAALGFERQAQGDLARMGLKRVADLLRLPRAGFAESFGIERLHQLERLLGERADPRRPFSPPERFRALLELPAEVPDAAALVFAGRRLIDELYGFLLARQAGVQHLGWTLSHADRAPTRFRLGAARPQRDPGRWLELLRERLERLRLPAPVRAISLASETLRPLAPADGELFPDHAAATEPDPALLDRLRARLGHAAVQGLALVRDHRPERAWRWCEGGQAARRGHEHDRAPGSVRADWPLWLLPAPVALPQRGNRPWLDGPLALGETCERIDTGWWDDAPVARDYYVATAASGERLWIYRDMHGGRGWFLHGIFGVAEEDPAANAVTGDFDQR